MNDYIDEEEKEIIESLHSEPWISDFNEEIKKMYEEYARNSLLYNKSIKIRVTERDFNHIKVKALQEGIPYQALISMLIHKFNEGQIAIIK